MLKVAAMFSTLLPSKQPVLLLLSRQEEVTMATASELVVTSIASISLAEVSSPCASTVI